MQLVERCIVRSLSVTRCCFYPCLVGWSWSPLEMKLTTLLRSRSLYSSTLCLFLYFPSLCVLPFILCLLFVVYYFFVFVSFIVFVLGYCLVTTLRTDPTLTHVILPQMRCQPGLTNWHTKVVSHVSFHLIF